MAEHFVSPCPLPTPYEMEILTILIEECLEVGHRASKMMRFGRDEVQPGQPEPWTNSYRLSLEIGDMLAMVEIAQNVGLIGAAAIERGRRIKRAKLDVYLQHRPSPSPEQ